ncbi:MAG: tetratricopeptide repeat-containing sulfotransferase family protein [Bacillota bacterium]
MEGEERLRRGDAEGARDALTRSLSLDGTPAATHYALGNCYRLLNLPRDAEAAYRSALARDKDFHRAWFGLAFLYHENGQRREAAETLKGLVQHFASNLDLQHQAGGLLGDYGEYAAAAAVYEDITKAEPQARNYQRLGQYYQKLGRYPEAAQALLRAIELNPDAGPAYLLFANTQQFSAVQEDRALVAQFAKSLESGTISPTTRICLHFALGKMHDDLGEYDLAFRHYSEGNRLRRPTQGFNALAWTELAARIGKLDGRSLTPPVAPSHGPLPLFIVGMLRSGTTLVERVLASHPQVIGLGEVDWLEEIVGRLARERSTYYPEFLGRLDASDVEALRIAYQRRWPKDVNNATYIIDKNPLNFIYLGFIARVFPGARIVHCRRDARDTCLSIYFQNFANERNNYAYALEDTGRFYNCYSEIMRHWRQWLPPEMIVDVNYEELVRDQESATRKLLLALGLPWDPHCLEFQSHSDGISTASVWQARQSIYASSVGRWHHYEQHLKDLVRILDVSPDRS